MTQREKILRRRIAELQARLTEAEGRGESESYLAMCRFKIDELEASLPRDDRSHK